VDRTQEVGLLVSIPAAFQLLLCGIALKIAYQNQMRSSNSKLPFALVLVYGTVYYYELTKTYALPDFAYESTSVLFMVSFNINTFLYVFWIKAIRESSVNLLFCVLCKRVSV
jgi:hypothetical protein